MNTTNVNITTTNAVVTTNITSGVTDAAQAGAVADKLALCSKVTSFSTNKFDKTTMVVPNFRIDALGNLQTFNGWNLAKIPVKESTSYSFRLLTPYNDSVGLLGYYDVHHNQISTVDMSTLANSDNNDSLGGKKLVTPINTAFIYINIKSYYDSTDIFQLQEGSYVTAYEVCSILSQDNKPLVDSFARLRLDLNESSILDNYNSINYNQDNVNANLNTIPATSDWFASANNFLIAETDPYLTGKGIIRSVHFPDGPVVASKNICYYKKKYSYDLAGKYAQTVFFMKTTDVYKFNFKEAYVATDTGSLFVSVNPLSFSINQVGINLWEVRRTYLIPTPASGSYRQFWVGARFGMSGTEPTAELTVSGFNVFVSAVDIRNKIVTQTEKPFILEKIDNPESFSKIKGKIWNVIGDSLTGGHNGASSSQTYPNYIAEKYKMSLRNYGIGGTRIASTAPQGDPMSVRYSLMNDDADIITVFGGTNDVGSVTSGDTPIGNNSDTTLSTFKGAMNVLCKGLIDKYPTKKIGFITPLNFTNSVDLLPVVNAIIEICGLYSIPVFNAYKLSGMMSSNTIQRQALFYQGTDYIHFNIDGHKYFASKLESFLESL